MLTFVMQTNSKESQRPGLAARTQQANQYVLPGRLVAKRNQKVLHGAGDFLRRSGQMQGFRHCPLQNFKPILSLQKLRQGLRKLCQ